MEEVKTNKESQNQKKWVLWFNNVLKPPSWKKYFLISLSIFLTAVLIGFMVGYLQSQEAYESTLDKIAQKVTGHIDWSDNFSIMMGIWKNNVRVGLILVVFTTLTTSIMAYILYIVNGGVVGYVLSKQLSMKSIMLILPHGIVEIPALILFGYIGSKYNLIEYVFFTKEEERLPPKEFFINVIKLVIIGVLMLLVSAFIETYITPEIASFF